MSKLAAKQMNNHSLEVSNSILKNTNFWDYFLSSFYSYFWFSKTKRITKSTNKQSYTSGDDEDEDWSERLLVQQASSDKFDNWAELSTGWSADKGLRSDTLLLPSVQFGIQTACSATVGNKRTVHFSRRSWHSWQLAVERTVRSIGGREFEAEVNTLVGPFTAIGYCFRSAESSSDALLQPVCRHSSDLQWQTTSTSHQQLCFLLSVLVFMFGKWYLSYLFWHLIKRLSLFIYLWQTNTIKCWHKIHLIG